MTGGNIDKATGIFLRELQFQCELALEAVQLFNTLMTSPPGSAVAARLMSALDDFIDHSARASLILWPIKKRGREESARNLRSLLGMPEDHILADRELRHHFQHLDERIEAWLENHPGGNFGDLSIGNPNHIEGVHMLRCYDPDARIYYFSGKPYDVEQYAAAIHDVTGRAYEKTGYFLLAR